MTSARSSARSSVRRVVVHVGLPKTGTTWIQTLLQDHREPLAAAGVSYPRGRPGLMFRSAVDVRGSCAKFGLDQGQVDGAWAELVAAAHEHRGTTVLGHEVLAGATEQQIEAALRPLADLETHVVVTARDLGRQAVAHWQEEVKLGDTRSFATFEREELRADTGPDAGPDAGGRRPHFWHAQDVADALRRWSVVLPHERVHLVLCPSRGAAPALLWQRFADATGVDPTLVDASSPAANVSLGAPEIALLREVNARLGERLDAATRLRVVKRDYAEGVLAARRSTPPLTPASLRPLLEEVTNAWTADIEAAGYPVHGDLADLTPVLGERDDLAPDQPRPADVDVDEVLHRLLGPDEAEHQGRLRWIPRRRGAARPR